MCPQQAHQISGQSDKVCPLIGIKIWSVLVLRNILRFLAAKFGPKFGPPQDRTQDRIVPGFHVEKFGSGLGPEEDRTQDRNAENMTVFYRYSCPLKSHLNHFYTHPLPCLQAYHIKSLQDKILSSKHSPIL